MTCEEVRELAGAYALDTLSPEESRAVDEHLRSCNLHEELVALRATAMLLPRGTEERDPPATLRARILDAAGEQAAPSRSAAELRPATRHRGVIGGLRRAEALAGILGVAVLVLLGLGVMLVRGGDQDVVRAVNAGPAKGTELRYWPDERVALLDVKGLAPLTEGRTYQVWTIRNGLPQGVALFNAPGDGAARVAFAQPLAPGDLVAVTVEPAGGSQQPTTDPLFAIAF